MRTSFWRGVLTGSIIGAAISMMASGRRGYISKDAVSSGAREAKSRAHRVLRGVSKSVNDLMK
ncbi:hypothetical protein ACOBQJ_13500 [Pelotomaculum propionicicum]|uniref:hypothetical protein n=1 Tax=Pelotomaculum propionicicum TaxID=258475 RepID=UPI003B7AB1D3